MNVASDGCGSCRFRQCIQLHKNRSHPSFLICSLTKIGIPYSLYDAIERGATLITCPLRGKHDT